MFCCVTAAQTGLPCRGSGRGLDHTHQAGRGPDHTHQAGLRGGACTGLPGSQSGAWPPENVPGNAETIRWWSLVPPPYELITSCHLYVLGANILEALFHSRSSEQYKLFKLSIWTVFLSVHWGAQPTGGSFHLHYYEFFQMGVGGEIPNIVRESSFHPAVEEITSEQLIKNNQKGWLRTIKTTNTTQPTTNTTPYNTTQLTQRHTTQQNTTNTTPYNTTQHNTTNTTPYNTTQHNTHNAIQHNTTQPTQRHTVLSY